MPRWSPILSRPTQTVHVMQRDASVNDVVNMTAIAVAEATYAGASGVLDVGARCRGASTKQSQANAQATAVPTRTCTLLDRGVY